MEKVEIKMKLIKNHKKIVNAALISILVLSSLAVFSFLQSTSAYSDPWWDTNWNYRREITIDPSRVTSDQTNFPVLLDITDASLSKAQADGDDFVFISATGEKLSHEVASFNSISGHLEAWVKIPLLSSTQVNRFFIYYGNPSSANQESVNQVWDVDNTLVFHLNEASGNLYDSTAYDNVATVIGATQGASGKISNCISFDGINDYLTTPHNTGLSGYTEGLTASFWLKFSDTSGRQTFLNKYDTIDNQRAWIVDYDSSRGLGFFASRTGGAYRYWYASFSPSADNWYHISVVWRPNQIPQFYVNGATVPITYDSGVTYSSIFNNIATPLEIGRSSYSGRYVDGFLDEIRVSDIARSSSYIRASYENQDNPGLFYSVGIEESLSPGPTLPTISNANPKDGATKVPLSLSELTFSISDSQGELLSYSVVTSPNVGTASATNVPSGTYSIPLNVLQADVTYTWTITVTDGTNVVTQTNDFTTYSITQKWVKTNLPRGFCGLITANLDSDPYEEIIMTGNDTLVCLDGQTGAIQWTYYNDYIGFYCQPQMADVNNDGNLEIVVPIEFPPAIVILNGRTGALIWYSPRLGAEGSITSAPVIGDIDGNGIPTIFVGREDAITPFNGGITSMAWDGTTFKILNTAWAFRPCSGGLSLADVDNNGVYEIFIGDRAGPDGLGVRSLNAHTLEPIWNRADILSSSDKPVLADVTGDGILDVIQHNQRNRIYVLDALTGATIKSTDAMPMPGHYQHSVYDIDGDGHLEVLLADGEHANTPSYILIWDLVDWKQDAIIDVGLCVFAPQLGDVTGDGVMDIIACNYSAIFIFTFDKATGQYVMVDQITNLGGYLSYAVVQDVDNDGLNEIIVHSIGRRVYVFDTLAPRPAMRARSEVQFYSERRMGAAEYVPPP